ncbi:phage head morphogenesis protein [uncultured Clostridium sp.]|uniref:phage head morphogenesis protein n=1 Tax=uncultured Clostridium sp. TaxID=59620 RepID=UPI0028EFFF98|nr:phage head morphogenesis protein [uncultured Clostridium sp.]
MDNHKDEVNFIESLYNNANDQLKDVYKEQKKNKDDLLKEIADVMLTYTIVDTVMKLSKDDQNKLSSKFLNVVTGYAKSQGALTNKTTTDILKNTVDNTFDYYSYNADLKDVKKIIDNNYKGKHFSERAWKNEKEVAELLHSQTQDFLEGKVNVNQIKKNIQDTYDNNAYEVKRLVDTEVSRCQNEAFNRFCEETNVKKLHYHATLCRSCSACTADDDEIFDFDSAPELPRHPICHCYYSAEE